MSYFAEKHYPEVLLPEDLDAYLEKGWYRMGQTIFTTHFLCFDKGFFSAIWVRLDLQNFSFNKRQRNTDLNFSGRVRSLADFPIGPRSACRRS